MCLFKTSCMPRHCSAKEAARILKEGGVVVFPTETVYGLGAVATLPAAVDKVFTVKRRPRDNPLICHFSSIEDVMRWNISIPPSARELMTAWWPGPVSFLLDLPAGSPLTPATLGRPSVICRVPDHPVALELIREVGTPIAAPSANTSGRVSGTELAMIEADLGEAVDGYVDGGPSVVGLESAIIDARLPGEVVILRPGVIGRDEIIATLKHSVEEGRLAALPAVSYATGEGRETTPGSRYPHYAPRTPLAYWDAEVLPSGPAAFLGTSEALTRYGLPVSTHPIAHEGRWVVNIGSRRDLRDVARLLYYRLYQLDSLGVERAYLVREDWGESSAAIALRNRLGKIIPAT